MKIYVICFTICFTFLLILAIPIEKIQAIQSIVHDLVQLKNDGNDQN